MNAAARSSQWSGAADHDERDDKFDASDDNDCDDASDDNDCEASENAIAHAYRVLGIRHNASKKEVVKAYKTLALIYHPDKSSCPQAAETFMKIKEAYDTLLSMQANMDTDEDAPAEDPTAASAKRTTRWLRPEDTPTFEVAYPSGWQSVNEDISKQMYDSFLAGRPARYTEPLTANGKGGIREYSVNWQHMTQTNIESRRQRSVRFRELQQDDNRSILTGKMRKS